MEMTLADSRVGFSAGSECFVQHLENNYNQSVFSRYVIYEFLLEGLHQPVKDLDVTVDRDVDIIQLLPKSDVPEVDHLLEQETLRTGEVLLRAPRLVAHVDHNLPPEGEENEKERRQPTCCLGRADEQGSGPSPSPWPGSPVCCSSLAHGSEQQVEATFIPLITLLPVGPALPADVV